MQFYRGFSTYFSMRTSSLLNDLSASVLAEASCGRNSSRLNAIRIPLPPPPRTALTNQLNK